MKIIISEDTIRIASMEKYIRFAFLLFSCSKESVIIKYVDNPPTNIRSCISAIMLSPVKSIASDPPKKAIASAIADLIIDFDRYTKNVAPIVKIEMSTKVKTSIPNNLSPQFLRPSCKAPSIKFCKFIIFGKRKAMRRANLFAQAAEEASL